MKFSANFRTIGWLIRDTFRQSLASGIFWVLLGISLVSIMVCLSAGVDNAAALNEPGENPDFLPRTDPDAQDPARVARSGVKVVSGEVTLAFGLLKVPLARDARSSIHFLQLILAAGVADTLGMLLTLVWTAGFVPGFLDPRSVTVLLAKPASRSCLLLGKYLGVLSFVLVHAMLFVFGTWAALGLRTGIWDANYLYCVPLLLLHFAIFFSVSLLLAVCTRNTVVCVFGSVMFWLLCWGMNFGRHAVMTAAHTAPEGIFTARLVDLANAGYWLLPKPADFGLLLFDSLGAGSHFQQWLDTAALRQAGCLSIELSILSSLAFTAYMLVAASRQFSTVDY